ncbi:MAG TPA: hypothetical protein VLH09_07120 [Bryobacteraceae bacterium]|nr:hypothetical protein [Bryobacteraceae bacterium]
MRQAAMAQLLRQGGMAVSGAWCALLLFLSLGTAAGQGPVVYPGGIVNAASFAPAGTPGSAVAPGSLAAIFGTNLAAVTMSADRTPLPLALGGTSVTIDGIPAPLLFVSPGQINAQIPWGVQAPVEVTVTTVAGVSEPAQVKVSSSGLGIFTLDGSGCGRGAVQNVAADGTVSLNSPENSAEPGSFVTVWGTGLTTVYSKPPDGEPAPSEPPTESYMTPGGRIYDTPVGVSGFLAPGLVGVTQFNVFIRPVFEGCAVPLRVSLLGSMTQPMPVSIHRGGGACVDPPPDSYGLLTWTRSVTIGSTTTTRETLTAEFPRAVNLQIPAYPAPGVGVGQTALPPSEAPECAWTRPALLGAGTLVITFPSSPSQVVPRGAGGTYEAALSPGTIRTGRFSVMSPVGAEVGSFATEVHAPDPITVTSMFSPDTVFGEKPVTVAWTGGSPDSLVEVAIYSNYFGQRRRVLVVVPASAGNFIFAFPPYGLPFPLGSSLEIVVRQIAPAPATFQAPGLTLGGRHMVVYETRFTDLKR